MIDFCHDSGEDNGATSQQEKDTKKYKRTQLFYLSSQCFIKITVKGKQTKKKSVVGNEAMAVITRGDPGKEDNQN